MSDAVNPDHYKRLPAEAIEIIEAMIAGAPDNKAAHLHGQAAKYDLRLWGKGKSLEDYLTDWQKHIWYALRLESHLLELIENQKSDERQKSADLQSLKDHPFGKLKTGSLNSDTIPEGYRKLNDSSEEPRQLGDLRWSVSEKRYVEISGDEIGYANRDNWAACRKIEPAIKQSLTTEPPDGWRPNDNVSLAMQMAANSFGRKDGVFNGANFSHAMRQLAGVTCNLLDGHVVATILEGRSDVEVLKGGSHYKYLFWSPGNTQSIEQPAEAPEGTGEVKPPYGWRWLEVGEVICKGDVDRSMEPIPKDWIGSVCRHKHNVLRRNKFEVGEKVKHINGIHARAVVECDHEKDQYVIVYNGRKYVYESKCLVPYIEDAKPTTEVTGEGTGEVKPPDGWRFLEEGEVIRKGDMPWKDGWVYATEPIMLGMTLQAHWQPMIRRNKFEVGERVVHVPSKDILEVVEVAGDVKVADIRGSVSRYYPELLAPYIEETK